MSGEQSYSRFHLSISPNEHPSPLIAESCCVVFEIYIQNSIQNKKPRWLTYQVLGAQLGTKGVRTIYGRGTVASVGRGGDE